MISRPVLALAAATCLVACSRGVTPSYLPSDVAGEASLQSANSGYRVLHSFGNGVDGAAPSSGLTPLAGEMYGETAAGGNGGSNYGTIYRIDTSGNERVVLNFGTGGTEFNWVPAGGLLAVNGSLFGVQKGEGTYDDQGGIFRFSAKGAYKRLFQFSGSSSTGTEALGVLVLAGNELAGATAGTNPASASSSSSCGTFYGISMTGKLRNFFPLDKTIGCNPSGLLYAGGRFYATTGAGGRYGNGTLLTFTSHPGTRVLHEFGGASDGQIPAASVIDVGGTVYGTTIKGGAHGEGTIFAVTLSGHERVLYSFRGGRSDGSEPAASLIYDSGVFYGTTAGGGAHGKGTVFSITAAGAERVLHAFGGSGDGASPSAPLVAIDGTLYGTTIGGGKYGGGTAFALTP